MRPFLSTLLLLPLGLEAQVLNGSFENNGQAELGGWAINCDCSNTTSSSDVPGGTGDWSLQMDASSLECFCLMPDMNHQPLPWLTAGTWTLSGWIKGVGPQGMDGSRVIVQYGTNSFNPTLLATIGTIDSVWAFREQTFEVHVGTYPDSLFMVLIADGTPEWITPHTVHFDDLRLDQSTGISDGDALILQRHPNPATDQLWVDLPESPRSITAVDPSGRRISLPTFKHNGRTLEVDVSSVPPGICVLLLKTASGVVPVRFIKA